MKKNWILFILICVLAYAWMLSRQYERHQQYQKKKEAYEVELAKWQNQQKERERQQREAEEIALQAREARRTGATIPAADPSTATLAAEVPSLSNATDGIVEEEPNRVLAHMLAERHEIDTPLYRVIISELGARPISWEIKDSPFVLTAVRKPTDTTTPTLQLIPQVGDLYGREYPLELTGPTAARFNFVTFRGTREETPEGTRLLFRSVPVRDMVVEKEFLFRNNSYVVDLRVAFRNGAETRKTLGNESKGFGIGWQGGLGAPDAGDRVTGVVRAIYALEGKVRDRTIARGAAPVPVSTPVDWAGLEKKYFTALLVPDAGNPVAGLEVYFNALRNDAVEYRATTSLPLSVELLHAPRRLELNESTELKYQLYVGPKNLEALSDKALVLPPGALAPAAVVFHTVPLGLGWLRPLCLWMLKLLRWLHDFAGSWGFAIIGTTIVVRTLIYPLTHWAIKNQARTMIEQQRIRPELEAINKKYKSDPMKRNQAIMQLYRDHNVNPLGFVRGCFPILLQMPVFLALYVVFEQSVELRAQAFLWMKDLSAPDALFTWGFTIPIIGPSFNLLPILMAATNVIQMMIMKTPSTDEMQERIQKQMMIMMPIMLLIFLYQLPSGLILYWTVSNVISIGQSYMTKRIIQKHMDEHGTASPKVTIEKSAA
jgi:YidC/Oxa1 family membrane protein insertase